MEWLARLFDELVPPRCIGCDAAIARTRPAICAACSGRLPWWRMVDGCPRCGSALLRPTDSETGAAGGRSEGCPGCLANGSALHVCRTLVRYEAPIDRWVPAFKDAAGPFGPATPVRLAIETLADELARRVAGETTQRPDLVVSIPLHPCRRRQRGFNHADPIAKRIARELNRPFSPLLLERIRDTQRQVSLVGQERRANVRGAFRSTTPLAATTHVWLVDDVLTTGSTLEAAAEALLEAGAFEVRALTLAATLPPRRAPRRKGPYSPGS